MNERIRTALKRISQQLIKIEEIKKEIRKNASDTFTDEEELSASDILNIMVIPKIEKYKYSGLTPEQEAQAHILAQIGESKPHQISIFHILEAISPYSTTLRLTTCIWKKMIDNESDKRWRGSIEQFKQFINANIELVKIKHKEIEDKQIQAKDKQIQAKDIYDYASSLDLENEIKKDLKLKDNEVDLLLKYVKLYDNKDMLMGFIQMMAINENETIFKKCIENEKIDASDDPKTKYRKAGAIKDNIKSK